MANHLAVAQQVLLGQTYRALIGKILSHHKHPARASTVAACVTEPEQVATPQQARDTKRHTPSVLGSPISPMHHLSVVWLVAVVWLVEQLIAFLP